MHLSAVEFAAAHRDPLQVLMGTLPTSSLCRCHGIEQGMDQDFLQRSQIPRLYWVLSVLQNSGTTRTTEPVSDSKNIWTNSSANQPTKARPSCSIQRVINSFGAPLLVNRLNIVTSDKDVVYKCARDHRKSSTG